ncbi:MAG TPA: TolC family protein [Thermoanaerobaculia bacterium]|nr:TolC family protein [Thermoanaerobaculia bacterium]
MAHVGSLGFSLAAAAFALLPPGAARAQAPISLDEAIREARASNAKLPMPAYDVEIARARVNEARAERWLKVAVEGDFIYAPPSGYDPVLTNLGEFRLQVVGRQPIYDGGARRAAVAKAEAETRAAESRYRVAEKDLVLDVVSRYNELLSARAEMAARRSGLSQLERYRSGLQGRQSSGQPVAADLLKTEVRLASEQASLLEAEKRADDSRMELNDLMGQDPQTPLEIASLPLLESTVPEPRPWEETPEISAARADEVAADAALSNARAEGKPHLSLSADFGFWGSDTSRWVPLDLKMRDPDATFVDRIRRDAGYSFTLSFTWPIFDFGAIRARVAQADLALEQARRKIDVAKRDSRLKWSQARSAMESLGKEVELLSHASPSARDALLDAESRYRGGAATSLEVLDAYSSAVDLSVRLSDAAARYRIARALADRWGSP